MKSVRLDEDLELKLSRAARLEGVSESTFIREAIAARADSVLSDRLEDRLAGVIGAVKSRKNYARDAHERYRELLLKRHLGSAKSRR